MSDPARLATFTRLREQHDARSVHAGQRVDGGVLPMGIGEIDALIGGGLPLGAVTEIVCPAPGCGGELLLLHLLVLARQARRRVALVDGFDDFDPASCPDDLLRHVVWMRCAGVAQAMQAVDIVARDANFGLVVLDLKRAPLRELQRVPGTTWYRLQRALEHSEPVLLVETPRATVPSAQLRLSLPQRFSLTALASERTTLIAQLAPVVERQRMQRAAMAG
jgi:hypothetical protein